MLSLIYPRTSGRPCCRHGLVRPLLLFVAAVVVIGGAVWLGIVIPSGSTSVSPSSGVPVVSDPLVSFGEVYPNADVVRTLELRNPFDATIYLGQVHTSCTCLVVELATDEIAPLGSVSATVRLKVPSYQDMPLRFSARIPVDGGYEAVTIAIKGSIPRVVRVEQESDPAGDVTGARLSTVDEQPFSISERPWFLFPAEDALEMNTEHRMTIDTSGRGVGQLVERSVQLAIIHPTYGQVFIPWSEPAIFPTRALPPMQPDPPELRLRAAEVAAGYEVDLTLRGPTDGDIELITWDYSSMPEATISLLDPQVVPEGIRYRLHIQAEPDRWAGGILQFSYDGKPACSMLLMARRLP